MRRSTRTTSGRRQNPLRDLATEQRRVAEAQRSRARDQRLQRDLPSIIESQVGAQMEKLENRLLDDFREMGEKVVEKGTAALSEQLDERIESLERMSSFQTGTILKLRNSSRVAEQKVSSVVNSIEHALSEAVPGGFRLDPHYPGFYPQLASPDDMDSSRCTALETIPASRHGFCPSCTSPHVRRAYRHGFLDEMLRLFFVAPFRCRSCRHKFYRF